MDTTPVNHAIVNMMNMSIKINQIWDIKKQMEIQNGILDE